MKTIDQDLILNSAVNIANFTGRTEAYCLAYVEKMAKKADQADLGAAMTVRTVKASLVKGELDRCEFGGVRRRKTSVGDSIQGLVEGR